MTLEELLANSGLRPRKFYEPSGSSGGPGYRPLTLDDTRPDTVTVDNRPYGQRPLGEQPDQYRSLISALATSGQAQNKSAEAFQGQQFNSNYNQSLARPFIQGPLPTYEILSKDPRWHEFYAADQPAADRVYGATHKRSYSADIKTNEEQVDFLQKMLQAKFAKRELFQDPFTRELKEIVEEPNASGEFKKVIRNASPEMTSALSRVGGPKGIGIMDINESKIDMSAAEPFFQGPLPPYKILAKDPEWRKFYETNYAAADKKFKGTYGISFTKAQQEDNDQLDFLSKTLQAKFAKGDLYQDPHSGELMEIAEEPNDIGELRRVKRKASIEMLSALQRVGGPEGIGLIDIKATQAAMEGRQRPQQQQDNKPVRLPPSETTEPVRGNLFGIIPLLKKLDEATKRNVYEDSLNQGVETYGDRQVRATGNWWKNIGRQFTGDVLQEANPPTGQEDIRRERQMIDIVRLKRNLGPISDKMWEDHLNRRYAGQRGRILREPTAIPDLRGLIQNRPTSGAY